MPLVAVAALVISIVSLVISIFVGWQAVKWARRQALATEAVAELETKRDRDDDHRRKTRRLARSMGRFYEERWSKD